VENKRRGELQNRGSHYYDCTIHKRKLNLQDENISTLPGKKKWGEKKTAGTWDKTLRYGRGGRLLAGSVFAYGLDWKFVEKGEKEGGLRGRENLRERKGGGELARGGGVYLGLFVQITRSI